MRKTALGCTILEGHDVADLPLVSENAEILELELAKKVAAVTGKALSTNDYTAAEKTKLDGVATGANNYTHPDTAGNKHIPAGGVANQILKYSAAGTAVWATESVTSIANNLTETVAGKALDAMQGKILKDDLAAHLADLVSSHLYLDVGTNPDYVGIKYRLVIIDGELFLEVVAA